MKVKYTIIYSYDRTGHLRYDGTAAVLIRAYLKGKNKYFNTKVYLEPKHWHRKTQRVINHPNSFQLNRNIQGELEKIESYELKVSHQEGSISLDRLGDYSKDEFDITFTDFFQKQLEESRLTQSSFSDQRQTLQKLKEYRSTIYFKELTFKFIKGFDNFLYINGLGVNTIAKHHKNLKKYVNLAIKFDFLDIDSNPYKRFKVKKAPTERVYLTEYELRQFEDLPIPTDKPHLQQIKDFFLFCCYTGLRYSDASQVNANHLTIKEDGIELYIKAQKTKKPLRLNLKKLFSGKPDDLIRKYVKQYGDFYWDDPDNPIPIFFGHSNQYINRELKKLVQGGTFRQVVKQNITVHVARHTFGTILAGKVSIAVLQRLMQHSRIKETMIYVHLNEQAINQALDKIEW